MELYADRTGTGCARPSLPTPTPTSSTVSPPNHSGPRRNEPDTNIADYDLRKFTSDFGHLKSGESDKSKVIRVGARIYNKRASGNKLFFYDVRAEGVKVQVMAQAQEVAEGTPSFEDQHLHLRRGTHQNSILGGDIG